MNEEANIFRAYQRRLLRQLKALKEALKAGDSEKADQLLDRLIEDTKADIAD